MESVFFFLKTGQLSHFNIDDWVFVSKYKHNCAIRKIFPEIYGMMVVFMDQNGDGYVYNPISNLVTKIPNFSPTTKGVIWETFELNKVTNFYSSLKYSFKTK